jgi:molybdate transport system substrate-binding protein
MLRALCCCMAMAGAVHAAEIRILAGSAVQPAMEELVPVFEKASGHRIAWEWGAAGGMAQRAQKGEVADAVLATAPQLEALEREGRVVRGTRRDLGATGVGVFVRKGAARPDIATPDAFRRAMLDAKSIGYNDPAAGAPVSLYLIELFQGMGIAAQMTPKTVVFTKRSDRFEAVARGDVEIGFNQVSEIVAQPTVDLVGPLPAPIQNNTTLSVGVLGTAANPQAAQAFIDFLATPQSKAVFARKGFERP